jgi:hypothetical protein
MLNNNDVHYLSTCIILKLVGWLIGYNTDTKQLYKNKVCNYHSF